MTFKVNLKRLIKYAVDTNKGALSLINRSKNKPVFLRNFKELLIKESLSLMDISFIFMRVNTIYKQASIERQTLRKKASNKQDLKRMFKEITNLEAFLV